VSATASPKPASSTPSGQPGSSTTHKCTHMSGGSRPSGSSSSGGSQPSGSSTPGS
jgi:hypothetical protein